MTRAPRSPDKLAASKARREAADASVVMADKVTPLVELNYHDEKAHVVVKATQYDWPDGKQTFTLEAQNSLMGDGIRRSQPCPSLDVAVQRADRMKQSFQQDVAAHLNKVMAHGK